MVEVSFPELYSNHEKIGEVILNPSYPSPHLMTSLEPLLSLRIFDVTVIRSDFTNPKKTPDIGPVRIIERPTFGHSS